MRDWAGRLEQRREQGLYRKRQVLGSPQGPRVRLDGQSCLNFCSNDYLGLVNHPQVVEAMAEACRTMGVGAGASHLVCGHHQAHHALEHALAEFTGREAALVFSSGYAANLGVLAALATRGDLVFQDRLNHASLLDGVLLSRATLKRFPHADHQALKAMLKDSESAVSSSSQRFVVTDGVFSMDGDLAPLDELGAVAKEHDALLIVDDAHGYGVLGSGGRGSVSHYGLSEEDVPLVVGTLGKALGTAGAFIAGPRLLIDYLVQFARPYIYTTAMPPAIAAATLVSLRLAEDEVWRRDHLQALIVRFRKETAALGYRLMASSTPIQPLLIGDAREASRLSQALLGRGIAVSAIRPPTVPEGSARLRVTLTSAHSHADLDQLLDALAAEQSSIGCSQTGATA
ncbi:8-amino-7-oxononanoate synthase [Hydrocarboniclastica marina]|uniref:8-amino-7-oxononanoate synthase n=1 Tax=Hydrocarboniclastica marina TaxID=2259620 RepID=A0A4P7XHV0_9ALTE|nr:8-amino-7-oxononanoate synthase [Hydrocarboniclastica marina]QCF26606.1 8-amino-7-oxononanoate synthase [Hydrocarboniclastica marina]